MNRRIKREVKRLGFQADYRIPLSAISAKLFHLIATRNYRVSKRGNNSQAAEKPANKLKT